MLPEGARVSRPPQLSPARTRRGIGRGKAGGTPALPSQRAAAATASRDMASIAATSSLRTYTPPAISQRLESLDHPLRLPGQGNRPAASAGQGDAEYRP